MSACNHWHTQNFQRHLSCMACECISKCGLWAPPLWEWDYVYTVVLAGIVVPANNLLITMILITMIWCSEQFWLFKVGQYDEGQKKNIQWNWSCVQTRKEKSRSTGIVIVISHEQWALIFQTVIPWEDSNSEQEMVWTLNKKLACDAFATVKYWYDIVTVRH